MHEGTVAVRVIGDVPVCVMRQEDALAAVATSIADGEPRIWAFCNAHTVNCARHDAIFRDALPAITFLNDGIGVDLASRMLYGRAFPDNLNGTDFTPLVLGLLDPTQRVYLLGSASSVAERAAAALSARFPDLAIAGARNGFFAPSEENDIAEAIAASGAAVVLVGMGNPQQELWAARNVARIGVPILCIGAFLDFSAGEVRRAPALVRRFKAEWVYRLTQEPGRLAKRYLLGNVTFLAAVSRQKIRARGKN